MSAQDLSQHSFEKKPQHIAFPRQISCDVWPAFSRSCSTRMSFHFGRGMQFYIGVHRESIRFAGLGSDRWSILRNKRIRKFMRGL
jgi:hypothetical protein